MATRPSSDDDHENEHTEESEDYMTGEGENLEDDLATTEQSDIEAADDCCFCC